MTRKLVLLALSSLLVVAGACSGDPVAEDGVDAGTAADAGATGGTDAGSNGGDDAGTSSGNDAGLQPDAGTSPDAGSGGDGGTAETVTLDLSATCNHTACGGAIADGVYRYTQGCVTNYFESLKQLCASAQLTTTSATVAGTLTFSDGNTVTRDVTIHAEGTAAVPAACLFGGTCATAEGLIAASFPGSTCTTSATGCDCNIVFERHDTTANNYSVSGNILTAGSRTYEYCVTGSTLTYRDATQNNPEPGVFTLSR